MIVVEVNETKILATRAGATWWTLYRTRRPVHDARPTPNGTRVHVECDDRHDAHTLIGLAVAMGAPRDALQIREVAA